MLGSRGSLADIISGSGRNTWQTYVDSLADTRGSGRHTGFYQRHGSSARYTAWHTCFWHIYGGSGRHMRVLVDSWGFW